jgi:methylenetetrahydrofolate dehydrogenase (NADP+)/methenyltetrahydrofolate cyclohydrolase
MKMNETSNTTTVEPRVLDGVAIAAEIKQEVGAEVARLKQQGVTPGLAVVLVGEVPASQIYVRSKVKTCGELGIYSELIKPPESVTTEELLELIASLNARDEIDGILIQLPLPAHVNTKLLLEAVSPEKDVDGFHPVNVGRLQSGQAALAPCTPAGIIEILKRSGIAITGKNAVVVGRSDIVGKPVAMMLLNQSATVTVCHSKTANLQSFTREADILVAAIGRPGFITADMVQPGATLIDVGINRITDAAEVAKLFPGNAKRRDGFLERGSTVVGDIEPAAFAISGAYTPVPGGVGALTIAMLMQNTLTTAKARRGAQPAIPRCGA